MLAGPEVSFPDPSLAPGGGQQMQWGCVSAFLGAPSVPFLETRALRAISHLAVSHPSGYLHPGPHSYKGHGHICPSNVYRASTVFQAQGKALEATTMT